MYFKIFIFFSIIILSSCQNNKDPLSFSPPLFKKQISVTPVEIRTNKILSLIFEIKIINNYIFTRAFDGKYAISVFDKTDGTYIKSIAQLGRGPGEFNSPVLHIYKLQDSIFIFEPTIKLLYEYSNQGILHNELPNRVRTPKGYNYYVDAFPLHNGKILSNPTKGARFAIHDSKGNLISSYNRYPSFHGITDSLISYQMYRGRESIDIKPDCSKFVTTCSMGSVLEIFSIQEDKIELYKELRFYPPKYTLNKNRRVSSNPDCLMGMWDINATNDYIYAIFSGKKIKEIKGEQLYGNYVYVFDWEGKPVISYKINKEITRLTIDENTKKAYVVIKGSDSTDVFAYFKL